MKRIVYIYIGVVILYICSVLCVFFGSVYFTIPSKWQAEYRIFPYPYVKLNNFSLEKLEHEVVKVEHRVAKVQNGLGHKSERMVGVFQAVGGSIEEVKGDNSIDGAKGDNNGSNDEGIDRKGGNGVYVTGKGNTGKNIRSMSSISKYLDAVECDDVRVEMSVYNLFFMPFHVFSIKNMDLYIKPHQLNNFLLSINEAFDTEAKIASLKIDDLNVFYSEKFTINTSVNSGINITDKNGLVGDLDVESNSKSNSSSKSKSEGGANANMRRGHIVEDNIASNVKVSLDMDDSLDISLLQINNLMKNGNDYKFLLNSRLLVETKVENETLNIVVADDNIKGSVHIELEDKELLLATYNLEIGKLSGFLLEYFNINLDYQNKMKLTGEFNFGKHMMHIESDSIQGMIKYNDDKIKGNLERVDLNDLLKLLYIYNPQKTINLFCEELSFEEFKLSDVKVDIVSKGNRRYFIDKLVGDLAGVTVEARGGLYMKEEDLSCFKGKILIDDILNNLMKEDFKLSASVKLTNRSYDFKHIRCDRFVGKSQVKINPLSRKIDVTSSIKSLDLGIFHVDNILQKIGECGYSLDFEVYVNDMRYLNRSFNKFKLLGGYDYASKAWKIDNVLLRDDLNSVLASLYVKDDKFDVNIMEATVKDLQSFAFLYDVKQMNLKSYFTTLYFEGEEYNELYLNFIRDNEFVEVKRLDFINSYGYFKVKGESDIESNEFQFHYEADLIKLNEYFNLFHGFINMRGSGFTQGNTFKDCMNNFKSKGVIYLQDVKLKVLLHDFIHDIRTNSYTMSEFHNKIVDISADDYIKIMNANAEFSIKNGLFKIDSLPFITDYINSGNMSVNFDFDRGFFNLFAYCPFYMEVAREDSLFNFKLFINGNPKTLGYSVKFDHYIIRLLFQRYFSSRLD